MQAFENENDCRSGGSYFFGQELSVLAERYGAPLFVISEKELKKNLRELSDKFMKYHNRISVHHPVKFEYSVANLQIVKIAGGCLEVSSVGELYKGLYAGFTGNQIVFSGSGKSEDEIEAAVICGVKSVSADSELELKRIADVAMRLNKRANVSICVPPEGFDSDAVENAVRYALENRSHISLRGYRFHSGTRDYDLKSFVGAFSLLLKLAVRVYIKTEYRPELLIIGGSLPLEKIAEELCAEMKEEKAGAWAGKENAGLFKDVELVLTPGKSAASFGIDRRPKAGIVLVRENGQAVMIEPAKKYGDLVMDGIEEQKEARNV